MAVIPAVVTTDARIYWPQMFGNLQTFQAITHFKVGEGGWVDPGGGAEPRVPDANLRRLDNNLQDIDVIVDPTRAPIDQRYDATPGPTYSRGWFSKDLDPADFTFVSPSTLRVRCLLDFSEFNDDSEGNNPEIWELGLFSPHPLNPTTWELMVAYATFPMETKDATKQIENIIKVVF
jgi:hypothetical protein